MVRTALRTAVWLVLIGILTVTVVPIGMRPHLGLGPEPERVAAFFVLGLLFSLAYERNWFLTLCLVVAAGFGIEALQMFSPTRHPTVDDAVVKAIAGIAGVLGGIIIMKRGWLRS
ncbi:VanZ family protein [Mesorhizobium waimense]|uniref:VanZ family protein n=1 Tax=Mesorhizobium waimense TaxID=1300307 RepID=A0A3A5KAC2_9HYPH|nr:VanZ family protein [Mesorhizobium waimense]RJT29438.1 VanZ family protein [Mesorhizobium waimense]